MHLEIGKQAHTVTVLIRGGVKHLAVQSRAHRADFELQSGAIDCGSGRIRLLAAASSIFIILAAVGVEFVLPQFGLFLPQALLFQCWAAGLGDLVENFLAVLHFRGLSHELLGEEHLAFLQLGYLVQHALLRAEVLREHHGLVLLHRLFLHIRQVLLHGLLVERVRR